MTATKPRKLPSISHTAKIGHADYRLWIEKYGWEPDPRQKKYEYHKNRRAQNNKALVRKHAGRTTIGAMARNPVLAAKASNMSVAAKKRAEFLKIPFDLTGKWVLEKLLAGRCEATGIPFDLYDGDRDNSGHRRMFGPSLDQIKPRGGYTKDNVQVVCWCYNAAKSTGTDADVLRMAECLIAKFKLGKYEG